MKNNKKVFRSNIGNVILNCLIRAFILGIVLMFIYDIADRIFYIPIFLLKITAMTVCLAIGLAVSIIVSAFRFTTVEVSEDEVVVKQIFKKRVFELDRYIFLEKTEYKKYNGSVSVIMRNKRYLIAKDNDENVVKVRLYEFSANGLYNIVDEINIVETELLDSEIKEEIIRDSWEDEQKFDLAIEDIIRFEWKSVRFNSLVFIGAAVLIVIAVILAGSSGFSKIKLWVIMFSLGLCIIEIPFEVVRTIKNSKKCPEFIEYKGEHLIIGEHHFIISDIEKIVLTSADRKSNSIYHVQRYMIIKTDTQSYKFWLGSEASMSLQDYKKLCDFIWCAFVNYPSKLKFNGKHSWLNT